MLSKPSARTRKRPKQERSRLTVEALLIATTRILTEEGWDRFTTNRVAEVAGVSIGSLYQYFPNKESLLFAVAEERTNELARIAQHQLEEISDSPILAVIRSVVSDVLTNIAINPDLDRILHERLPHHEVVRQSDKVKVENLLRASLAQECPWLQAKDLDLTAFMVERIIRSLIYEAIMERSELLNDGKLEAEIAILLSCYLSRKRSLN